MTANIVPVCSITSSRVIDGDEGSNPSSFSATTTWAELETGNNSASPCTMARMMIFKSDIQPFNGSSLRARIVAHRRSNPQGPQIFLDFAAIAFAAGHGRAAGQGQDEVAAQRAVHFPH